MQHYKQHQQVKTYVKVKPIEKKFNVFAIVLDDEYAEIFADEFNNTVTWLETIIYNTKRTIMGSIDFTRYCINSSIINGRILYNSFDKIKDDFIQSLLLEKEQIDKIKDDTRPPEFTPLFSYGSPGSTSRYTLKGDYENPSIVENEIKKKYDNIMMCIATDNKIEIINAINEFLLEDCSPAWMNHIRFISYNESTEYFKKKSTVMTLVYKYCY